MLQYTTVHDRRDGKVCEYITCLIASACFPSRSHLVHMHIDTMPYLIWIRMPALVGSCSCWLLCYRMLAKSVQSSRMSMKAPKMDKWTVAHHTSDLKCKSFALGLV